MHQVQRREWRCGREQATVQEQSLFGLRFDSNADLNPTREDLRLFLLTSKPGSREPHERDLEPYRALLEGLQAFEERDRTDPSAQDIRVQMYYAVLARSQFLARGLELAVEQYKYHLHALGSDDRAKAAAFVRAARAEMRSLDPGKRDEAARIERLRAMIEARELTISGLAAKRRELGEELASIARYVRDNLQGVRSACRRGIAVLSDPLVSRSEELRLTDEIRERVKEQLRSTLHAGRLTREDLAAAKREANVLFQEAQALFRDDAAAMIRLLEAVHDHAGRHADGLDRLLAGRRQGAADDIGLFGQIEDVLVSLVFTCRFDLRTTPYRSRTPQDDMLREARRGLVGRLLALIERERRVRRERRSGQDRRESRVPCEGCPERRKGGDRRAGASRRN